MIFFLWVIGILILMEFDLHFAPQFLILFMFCWTMLCVIGGLFVESH